MEPQAPGDESLGVQPWGGGSAKCFLGGHVCPTSLASCRMVLDVGKSLFGNQTRSRNLQSRQVSLVLSQ